MPDVFDETKATYDEQRRELSELLTPEQWRQARRTVLNAHFTDQRVVTLMWEALQQLGFTEGNVLEPGSGAGGFIGHAPTGARVVGVELDEVSADIARMLYPSAVIRHESFADTFLPRGSFDAAIGNVPFGRVALHDRLHNPHKHSIHNHFILKTLDLTRPGGVVALITSRFTLDSADSSARREMAELADLITAIRLPTGAHKELAGTEAVSDILIFKVRPEGATRAEPADWIHTQTRDLPDRDGVPHQVNLNTWWDINPNLILGDLSVTFGMHNAQTLVVQPKGNYLPQLEQALEHSVSLALLDGNGYTPPSPDDEAQRAELHKVAAAPPRSHTTRHGDPTAFEGFLTETTEGFFEVVHGVPQPVEVKPAHVRPLRLLLGIRDIQLDLLTKEAANPEDTDEIRLLRRDLNTRYDAFAKAFGAINKVTVTVSARTDRHGQPIVSRRKPGWMKIFDTDPFSGAVRGLELYDEKAQTAAKAAIFERRVVKVQQVPTSAETPADALAIAMDQTGGADLGYIARLLDVTTEDARKQLGDLVFDDPVTGNLVPRAQYLSGNVRKALKAAQEAALENPDLRVNVAALRQVIPRDLGPSEIKLQLGSSWVPDSDVEAFATEILRDRTRVNYIGGGRWAVQGGARDAAVATQTWGTTRMSAHALLDDLLNQKKIVVYDYVKNERGNDTRILNPVDTAAAQEKAEQLQERFTQWAWSDGDRALRLCQIYNDTFNAIALREYNTEGQQLTLPGLAATFNPHPHQRTAVARIIAEPAVGMYHGVGAGKTSAFTMGVVELRRLGLVQKPCIVVPNHMLEQVSREFMQLYPRARVLAAGSEDLRGEQRSRFVGRAAMGDWDAVILTHNAFGSIPVSKATEINYINQEVDALRASLESAKAAGVQGFTTKRIEKAIERLQERLKAELDRPRDSGLTFEQTGIDYLVVDELHEFKNLAISSKIEGVGGDGSLKARDLDMKLSWLRENTPTGRTFTGATATPIANSVAECWVMQHYLRPDLLADAGVGDFDSWAGTFGQLVTELEMRPEGGYGQKTRFARFDNLPELLRLWHVSADVKTSDSLNLPIPAQRQRADGKRAPETVVVPRSPEMATFMEGLATRAEKLRGGGGRQAEKGADNMLVVSMDGRKAALDLRMLDRTQLAPVASTPSKVDYVADRIHQIWIDTLLNQYTQFPGTSEEQPHPRSGSLQIVFADLGTPSSDPSAPWSFYTELRNQLRSRGMDPTRIRFVQEANNDEKKHRLFEACREGQVDVLIGSTQGMGVGTNVQTRAIALHHVDCPWRPADVEQREGRILRQGNQNPEIGIFRYVTEGSFDAFSWQTVERKARFISQVMNGTLETRSAEDLSTNQALSFSEVKALATGNPLILERAQAEQELAKLNRLKSAHDRNQSARHSTITRASETQKALEAKLPILDRLIASRLPTGGEAFSATIAGTQTSERGKASELLGHLAEDAWQRFRNVGLGRVEGGDVTIGTTRFTTHVGAQYGEGYLEFTFEGLTDGVSVTIQDALRGSSGMVTRLENRINGLDTIREETVARLERARTDLEEAQLGLAVGFPRAAELSAAARKLEEIDQLLEAESKAPNDTGQGRDDTIDDPSSEAPALSQGAEYERRDPNGSRTHNPGYGPHR